MGDLKLLPGKLLDLRDKPAVVPHQKGLMLVGAVRDLDTKSGNPYHDPNTGRFTSTPFSWLKKLGNTAQLLEVLGKDKLKQMSGDPLFSNALKSADTIHAVRGTDGRIRVALAKGGTVLRTMEEGASGVGPVGDGPETDALTKEYAESQIRDMFSFASPAMGTRGDLGDPPSADQIADGVAKAAEKFIAATNDMSTLTGEQLRDTFNDLVKETYWSVSGKEDRSIKVAWKSNAEMNGSEAIYNPIDHQITIAENTFLQLLDGAESLRPNSTLSGKSRQYRAEEFITSLSTFIHESIHGSKDKSAARELSEHYMVQSNRYGSALTGTHSLEEGAVESLAKHYAGKVSERLFGDLVPEAKKDFPKFLHVAPRDPSFEAQVRLEQPYIEETGMYEKLFDQMDMDIDEFMEKVRELQKKHGRFSDWMPELEAWAHSKKAKFSRKDVPNSGIAPAKWISNPGRYRNSDLKKLVQGLHDMPMSFIEAEFTKVSNGNHNYPPNLKAAIVEAFASRLSAKQTLDPLFAKPLVHHWHNKPWPEDEDDLKLVPNVSLGGSTGAKLVYDEKTDLKYVKKPGGSKEHVEEEMVADTLYAMTGARVPPAARTADGEKLSVFVSGKEFGQLTGDDRQAAWSKLEEHFAMDALLANRDVLGLSEDNVLVDDDGNVWRIDNGSALRYRAQGGKKEDFGMLPLDLWTMRGKGPGAGSTASNAFKHLSIEDVLAQADKIIDQRKELLDAIPDEELRDTVELRIRALEKIKFMHTDASFDDEVPLSTDLDEALWDMLSNTSNHDPNTLLEWDDAALSNWIKHGHISGEVPTASELTGSGPMPRGMTGEDDSALAAAADYVELSTDEIREMHANFGWDAPAFVHKLDPDAPKLYGGESNQYGEIVFHTVDKDGKIGSKTLSAEYVMQAYEPDYDWDSVPLSMVGVMDTITGLNSQNLTVHEIANQFKDRSKMSPHDLAEIISAADHFDMSANQQLKSQALPTKKYADYVARGIQGFNPDVSPEDTPKSGDTVYINKAGGGKAVLTLSQEPEVQNKANPGDPDVLKYVGHNQDGEGSVLHATQGTDMVILLEKSNSPKTHGTSDFPDLPDADYYYDTPDIAEQPHVEKSQEWANATVSNIKSVLASEDDIKTRALELTGPIMMAKAQEYYGEKKGSLDYSAVSMLTGLHNLAHGSDSSVTKEDAQKVGKGLYHNWFTGDKGRPTHKLEELSNGNMVLTSDGDLATVKNNGLVDVNGEEIATNENARLVVLEPTTTSNMYDLPNTVDSVQEAATAARAYDTAIKVASHKNEHGLVDWSDWEEFVDDTMPFDTEEAQKYAHSTVKALNMAEKAGAISVIERDSMFEHFAHLASDEEGPFGDLKTGAAYDLITEDKYVMDLNTGTIGKLLSVQDTNEIKFVSEFGTSWITENESYRQFEAMPGFGNHKGTYAANDKGVYPLKNTANHDDVQSYPYEAAGLIEGAQFLYDDKMYTVTNDDFSFNDSKQKWEIEVKSSTGEKSVMEFDMNEKVEFVGAPEPESTEDPAEFLAKMHAMIAKAEAAPDLDDNQPVEPEPVSGDPIDNALPDKVAALLADEWVREDWEYAASSLTLPEMKTALNFLKHGDFYGESAADHDIRMQRIAKLEELIANKETPPTPKAIDPDVFTSTVSKEDADNVIDQMLEAIDKFKAPPMTMNEWKNGTVHSNRKHTWSHEEGSAVSSYKGGSTGINGHLRGKSETGSHNIEVIKNLDSAMDKTQPLTRAITVYRGVGQADAGGKAWIKAVSDADDGSVIVDRGFLSTSRKWSTSGGFGSKVEIRVPAGTQLIDAQKSDSGFQNEAEFILPRGSHFLKLGTNANGIPVVLLVDVKREDPSQFNALHPSEYKSKLVTPGFDKGKISQKTLDAIDNLDKYAFEGSGAVALSIARSKSLSKQRREKLIKIARDMRKETDHIEDVLNWTATLASLGSARDRHSMDAIKRAHSKGASLNAKTGVEDTIDKQREQQQFDGILGTPAGNEQITHTLKILEAFVNKTLEKYSKDTFDGTTDAEKKMKISAKDWRASSTLIKKAMKKYSGNSAEPPKPSSPSAPTSSTTTQASDVASHLPAPAKFLDPDKIAGLFKIDNDSKLTSALKHISAKEFDETFKIAVATGNLAMLEKLKARAIQKDGVSEGPAWKKRQTKIEAAIKKLTDPS